MTNSSAATVFLIDDHPAVRQGLALLLTQAGHRVCGEAGNHAETHAFLAGGQSDIAILDLQIIHSGLHRLR
jgi:DNA-binding NarL/FixJ family response regulator